MSRPRLYAIYYSPWSERARWALDYHDIDYRYREHVPFLGERLLRFRAGSNRSGKKATAPLLVLGDERINDSFDIASYADRVGAREPLIEDRALAAEWRDRIERGLGAARSCVTGRVLRDSDALRESAMAVSPAVFAGLFRPLARHGAGYIARKYRMDLEDEPANRQVMREVLTSIREALDGREHMAGERLSLVDIMATNLVQCVRPVQVPHMNLPPATFACWRSEELERDFADLVNWRDELYARARHPH